ncbi:unnamed protein product [Cuscuta europaea]|uniref:LOB domain-containing protein n=1 Tax=Cuscuta europaea TaxID=41803 RepID=A0A9P0ZF55_CUSEU|nr:unnamed protein product [Cuscuta europaea]
MSSTSPTTSTVAASGGSGGGPCGACKFLRRKCVPGCIFAPYFDSEQGAAHFAAVHKVFGASNVSKLLLHIPVHKRPDAVVTICYEAQARLRDPVYGCVAQIFTLQQQVVNLQAELAYIHGQLATVEVPAPPPVPMHPSHPHQSVLMPSPALNPADLPTGASVLPSTYDLSPLFDPMAHQAWPGHQRQLDPRHLFGHSVPRTAGVDMPSSSAGGGDLQAVARELMNRRRLGGSPTIPCPDAPST